MDRLASCYFCGGALDASLKEYPVVPKEIQAGEDSRTVVLCRGCRRKLGTIIEEVVAATESEASADGDTSGEQDLDAAGFEPIDSDDAAQGDDGLLAGGDDATAEDSGGLLDGSGSTVTDEGPDSTDHRATASETGTAARDPSEPAESPADGTDTPADTDDSGPSLTRLEYNKVMRLLQNREFPVDRGEIREVATSAYQISPEEFDAVIDAAIERDLIAERDGQFVTPE